MVLDRTLGEEWTDIAVRTIAATTKKDGRWWYVSLPELGTSGQAARLNEVSDVAREIAALWLDVDEKSLAIEVTVEAPGSVRALWDEAKRQEEEAAAERSRHAAALSRQAVRELREADYTLEAVARTFNISRQRAQQLAKSAS